jgi:hypothetical protein
MSFEKLSETLIKEFNKNNFKKMVKNKEKYKKCYKVPNKFGLNLKINYPGYKSEVIENGHVYNYEDGKKKFYGNYTTTKFDYRVDLNNHSISHVNIVIDLYNKGLQLLKSNQNIYLLTELLFNLARKGDDYNRNKFLKLNEFNFNPPAKSLLENTSNIHKKFDKNYNQSANRNWVYSLDELANVIIWIVLQEDINYPHKRCEGRKMPFKRYLETLYCCKHKDKRIDEVIERTLTEKYIPENWNDVKLNYENIDELW